jgi:hypothetical protein
MAKKNQLNNSEEESKEEEKIEITKIQEVK